MGNLNFWNFEFAANPNLNSNLDPNFNPNLDPTSNLNGNQMNEFESTSCPYPPPPRCSSSDESMTDNSGLRMTDSDTESHHESERDHDANPFDNGFSAQSQSEHGIHRGTETMTNSVWNHYENGIHSILYFVTNQKLHFSIILILWCFCFVILCSESS